MTSSASLPTMHLVRRLVSSTPRICEVSSVDGGALLQIDDGLRVENALAGAGALTVVLLDVGDVGVLAHVEGVDAVVLGGVAAAVVDAAARDNLCRCALADIEVVIDQIVQAALGEHDGDMDALEGRVRGDVDVDAGLVGLRRNLDVLGAAALDALAVGAEVESACGWDVLQTGDLVEQILFQFVQHYNPSCSAAAQVLTVSRRISG